MFKKTAGLFLLLFLFGCGAGIKPTYGPDGSASYTITCHPDISECLESAGNICGNRGYNVVVHTTHSGGAFADLFPGPVTWHNVLISCN
jgi:hypothetical protein